MCAAICARLSISPSPRRSTEKLKALGRGARAACGSIPRRRRCALRKLLEAEGAKFVPGSDPCILPKAIKNAIEIKGARAGAFARRRGHGALPRLARRDAAIRGGSTRWRRR